MLTFTRSKFYVPLLIFVLPVVYVQWILNLGTTIVLSSSSSETVSRETTKQYYSSPRPHFCTAPSYVVPVETSEKRHTIKIQYQCSGDEYEAFAKQMDKLYISKDKDTKQQDDDQQSRRLAIETSTTWGRRIFPLPANTTVLVMGNSHLNQVIKAIECQFADQIESYKRKEWKAYVIGFKNGSILIVLPNSPLVYSRVWQNILENDVLVAKKIGNSSELKNKVPISTLDAIIFGDFNRRSPYNINTKWYKEMTNYSSMFPDQIHFETAGPPGIEEIAHVYGRILIFVSMFGYFNEGMKNYTRETVAKIEHQYSNRSAYVNGRIYVDMLENECATNLKADDMTKGPCLPDYVAGHRCTGSHGGHPDLSAFDLVEVLHQTTFFRPIVVSLTRDLH